VLFNPVVAIDKNKKTLLSFNTPRSGANKLVIRCLVHQTGRGVNEPVGNLMSGTGPKPLSFGFSFQPLSRM
jgi:hypothetical protein